MAFYLFHICGENSKAGLEIIIIISSENIIYIFDFVFPGVFWKPTNGYFVP